MKFTTLINKEGSISLSSISFLQESKTQWSYNSKFEFLKLEWTYVVNALIYFVSYLSKYPPFSGEKIWIKWKIEEELNE